MTRSDAPHIRLGQWGDNTLFVSVDQNGMVDIPGCYAVHWTDWVDFRETVLCNNS